MQSLPQFAGTNLVFAAQTLDDLEVLRIASAHRFRALTNTEPDSDGIVRGPGLPLTDVDVVAAFNVLTGIQALEAQAIKELESQMAKHPLGAFIATQKGVGMKTGARLLASIGDPYWMSIHAVSEDGTETRIERPRTVSELWSYCGYGVRDGVAIRRTKGVQSNWNDDAKKRVWIITSAAAKFIGSPLDVVQREYKAKHEGAVHFTNCVRCGPSGKPALAGSSLSAGHLHARAIRYSSKDLLRQLWVEAKKFYDDPELLVEAKKRAEQIDAKKLKSQARAAKKLAA